MEKKMLYNFPLQVFLHFWMVSFLAAMKTHLKKTDAEQSPCDSKSFVGATDSVSKKQRFYLYTAPYPTYNQIIYKYIIGHGHSTSL